MEQAAEEIYRSSNGDRWMLIRDGSPLLVRHEANPSSGGQVTGTDAFLSVAGAGPEFAALRRLLSNPADPTTASQFPDSPANGRWDACQERRFSRPFASRSRIDFALCGDLGFLTVADEYFLTRGLYCHAKTHGEVCYISSAGINCPLETPT
jgi:hypothetical protein